MLFLLVIQQENSFVASRLILTSIVPVTAAAAAAFWYHIVHILLYTEPELQDESYPPLIQDQAMRVTNIAISDFPAALKVFSSHGLFYGKLTSLES